MDEKRTVERRLHFDLNGMKQRAYVGVRRAAGFLGLSERFLEGEFPRSLTLGRNIKRPFLPDPLPQDLIPELREAWQAWIVGNALRELDQFLSLYLDEAFDMTEMAKLVRGEYPPHYVWKRLDGITNVAKKHRQVLIAVNRLTPPHNDDNDCLVSLSDARNCLSHGLGLVTEKRASDGALAVKWLALQTIIQQGEKEVNFEELEGPYQLDPDGPDGNVFMRVAITERRFAIGQQIIFSPDDLLAICLFYQIVIDRVTQAVAEYARECGVPFDAPPPAPPP